MKLGSLFSGIGGLDLAVQEAFPGAELVWLSEVEKSAVTVLEQRFPGVPNLGDITQVDWSQVEPVDIIAGGSPCQDLSSAGARQGMFEGTRSGLWFNMLKAIRTIKPKYVVWENVKGAYSARASSDVEWQEGLLDARKDTQIPKKEKDYSLRALGRVLGDLHEAGYDAAWTDFRASVTGGHTGESESLSLLPTLTSRDYKDSAMKPASHRPKDIDTINRALAHADPGPWGKYEPAIRSWEQALDRPAPDPVTLNRNGDPQLSAKFAEWMMGFPEGWVTEAGISRTNQLKALGNAVVPQQGAQALKNLRKELENGNSTG